MTGRNHLPSRTHHHLIDEPRLLNRHHATAAISANRPHPSVLLEDRIEIQHREIQALLLDNQRLAATHVALKQELALADEDIRHISAAAASVKAERDDEVREVYERSLKMEAEARAVDAMSVKLNEVRADIEKLNASRMELTARLQDINAELANVQPESEQVLAMKTEIETIGKEVQKGRAAIEMEKKTHAANLEHRQVMEKSMVSMTREIEKLHAELANAEKRARAAAAANPGPGYAAPSYGTPEMGGYGGSPYPDSYGLHQGDADAIPEVSGATSHGSYDAHGVHVTR
ncbi:protein FLC EXPRESSOR isoform X2 [Tripterygium wilfordii]|uniref:protein FLC EXPRESSOR isoform X2 n=1 Tax=Tripterygium wilfordii TaxID=458696 RepID=UPI0018F84425|nr:protein FLC EXPRESSOR isoform X2 [Tripterygium wilfordii]